MGGIVRQEVVEVGFRIEATSNVEPEKEKPATQKNQYRTNTRKGTAQRPSRVCVVNRSRRG